MNSEILNQLVTLSNNLGRPECDYVILGEGNTSARADQETYWIKASGTELRTITAAGFLQVSFKKVLDLLKHDKLSDKEIKEGITAAKSDPQAAGYPSVETILHALCYTLEGVNFVGHTHPTAVNGLTCSVGFEMAFNGRLFPDEIVLCGVAPLLIPYTDPGLPLARKVQEELIKYLDVYREAPKVILMQNHGFIALGSTPQQVENITAMGVKAARILQSTYALGGPHFLSPQAVERIHTRPDELYRRKLLA